MYLCLYLEPAGMTHKALGEVLQNFILSLLMIVSSDIIHLDVLHLHCNAGQIIGR